MNKKKLIWAAAALLVLCGAYLALRFALAEDKPQQQQQQATERITIFSANENAVVAFQTASETESFKVVKQEDTWYLADDEHIPVVQIRASGVARNLTRYAVESVEKENATDLSAFGLNPARVTTTLYFADGSEKEFYIGSRIQGKDMVYVAVQGDSNVYGTSVVGSESLTYTRNDLIDYNPDVMEVKKAEMQEVTLSRPDGLHFTIRQDMDSEIESWAFTQPFSWNVDMEVLQDSFLTFVMLDVPVLQYVTQKTDAEMGLNYPSATVSVLKTDGTTRKFYVGNVDEQSGNVYVRVDGIHYPVLVNYEILRLTNLKKFDIIDKYLQTPDYGAIQRVSLSGMADIQLNYADKTCNGKSVSEETAIRMYSDACELLLSGELDGKGKGTQILKIDFMYKKGITQTFTVYDYNGRSYALTTDNKNYFLVYKDSLDAYVAILKAYL